VFGVSRQAYYQCDDSFYERETIKGLLPERVDELRRDMPRLGCVKLYEICKKDFGEPIMMGRDAFISLLRESGRMLRIKKRRIARTTDSTHPYRKYPDLAKGYRPDAPCRLWASDITYIVLESGFCCLSLITDVYSRKIVGWEPADSLKYIHTGNALRAALRQAVKERFNVEGMIHHSDRGVQYAYPGYTDLLASCHCRISMTQSGDPRDNAVAERVNGILKTEWLNAYDFTSLKEAKEVVTKVIGLYNGQRPHMSIGYQVPDQVHQISQHPGAGDLPVKEKCSSFVPCPAVFQ
jgi:transposase InsO family protein